MLISFFSRTRCWLLGLACALGLVLVACGGGGGGGASSPSTDSGGTTSTPTPEVAHGDTSTATLTSSDGGVDYPLRIATPPGYAANPGARYPLVVGLDGDIWFGQMVSTLEQLGIPAIVVGIGRADRRDFDYQVPGAPYFYAFVTHDLLPYMDRQYRTQSQNRTLVGHSFGGTFVGLALFMDQLGGAPAFSNYVSLDGAWDENSSDLRILSQEQALYASGRGLTATVVLAGATCCHYQAAKTLYTQMQAHHYTGLRLTLAEYPQSHANMFVPAYTDAVKYLFGK